MLEGNLAGADSTVWERLRERRMVLLGHTHTHEFAAGGTTDQVGNPQALRLIAGGSSGGSAAALAARMTPAALGSDTCGSLRIPSACCGTCAIKPTHGRLPLDGIVPLAPSLDHPGPMARTIADCAALLAAMAAGGPGHAADAAARPARRPAARAAFRAAARCGRHDVALTDRTHGITIAPRSRRGLEEAARMCERLGARIVELPAPWTFDWDDLSCVLLTDAVGFHRDLADRHDATARRSPSSSRRPATSPTPRPTSPPRPAAAEGHGHVGGLVHGRTASTSLLEPTLPILPYERGPGYDRGHAGGPGDPLIELHRAYGT